MNEAERYEFFENLVIRPEGEEPGDKKAGRGKRLFGHLLSIVGVLLALFVIAACIIVVAPRVVGYDSYIVVSGSMEPALPVGCIVYAKETDPKLLRAGDVIVFNDPSRGTAPITHRVVSNNPFTETIRTKGDANQGEDVNPVNYENVVGKVERHLPKIGVVISIFSTKTGKMAAAILLMGSWFLVEIGSRLKKKDKI